MLFHDFNSLARSALKNWKFSKSHFDKFLGLFFTKTPFLSVVWLFNVIIPQSKECVSNKNLLTAAVGWCYATFPKCHQSSFQHKEHGQTKSNKILLASHTRTTSERESKFEINIKLKYENERKLSISKVNLHNTK